MSTFGKDNLTDAELLASHGIFAHDEGKGQQTPNLDNAPTPSNSLGMSLTRLVPGDEAELEETPK